MMSISSFVIARQSLRHAENYVVNIFAAYNIYCAIASPMMIVAPLSPEYHSFPPDIGKRGWLNKYTSPSSGFYHHFNIKMPVCHLCNNCKE